MLKNSSIKVIVLSLGIFFLDALLIVKFFSIQIINGEKWEEIARKQHFFLVKEPFTRGTFWSNAKVRKGHPDNHQRLAVDIQSFHLFIDPLSIPKIHRETISEHLQERLSMTDSEKMQLRKQFEKNSRSRKLASWLEVDSKEGISAWWSRYAQKHKIARNALYFVPVHRRSHPFGKLLGQVLHTIQAKRDESTDKAYPTGGLELAFDSYLKGKQGKRLLKRSPRHAFETGQVLKEAEDGADIYLTINHCLQAIAEEELERGVKRCRAKGGWTVMMEPVTGELLALAQYPFFNPEYYNQYFNDHQLIAHTKVKAVSDAQEPGSVLKPFTLFAAFLANQELIGRGETPLFDPEEKLPCSDQKFPGRIKPLKDGRVHRFLNMNMALQKSSNIYFARLVERIIERLGPQWYRNVLEEKFGFGLRSGIELPSESRGLLPQLGKTHPNGALEWSVPTPFSLAIGHNIQLNSLQLVRAYSILANGGTLVRPTLVKKIVRRCCDGKTNVLLDNTRLERKESFPRVIDAKIVQRVIQGMKFVTKPGGTGWRADISGYTEIGKTGTAHKTVGGTYSQTAFLASFIGIAPLKEPAFVLLVVMDEPKKEYIPCVGSNHHGSVSAAPVFKAIATRALRYLGRTPDDPFGYPFRDPRHDPNLADWVLEARELRKLYEEWNG